VFAGMISYAIDHEFKNVQMEFQMELKIATESIDTDETDYQKHSYITEVFLNSRSNG
jgi:hypothetical protein